MTEIYRTRDLRVNIPHDTYGKITAKITSRALIDDGVYPARLVGARHTAVEAPDDTSACLSEYETLSEHVNPEDWSAAIDIAHPRLNAWVQEWSENALRELYDREGG